jgi:AraC-like DNA-binding protein
MGGFARIVGGREGWDAHASVPRHRHDMAYAAVVLSGGYEECGSRGRFRVMAGDVLVHGVFDAHLDRFAEKRTHILNLVSSTFAFPVARRGRIDDPDELARIAERDCNAAMDELRARMVPVNERALDWPDILANDLLADPDVCLRAWARAHDLAPETVSRGFGKVFGVTPARFRAEARAQATLAAIAGDRTAQLAAISADYGFADQAHMTRAVKALTGHPPARWLKSNRFKTVVRGAA